MSMAFAAAVEAGTASDDERPRPVVVCGQSRTKQSFRDQVNINSIMARYNKTGMITHLNRAQPFYGDVSEVGSYQESLAVVQKAQELFAGLSSDIRTRFANDPAQYIAFMSDPKNKDEIYKLGLATKKEEPVEKVQKVEVVNAPEPRKGRKSADNDD